MRLEEEGRWKDSNLELIPPLSLHLEGFPDSRPVLSLLLGPPTASRPVAIDPKEFILLVGKAQIADAGLSAATAGPRVDDGVTDAAIAHPPSLTLVQQLDLPGGVELANLGHRGPVLLASLDGLREAQLAVSLEKVDFPWKGGREKEETMGNEEGVTICSRPPLHSPTSAG